MNLCAQRYLENEHLKQCSHVHEGVGVHDDEMKPFLATVMLMGPEKLPTMENDWSRKILFNHPVFKILMTRNRLQLIWKFLHFHGNNDLPVPTDPHCDRLHKIRPVTDHLQERFQEVYEPRKDVSVDESP